MAISARGDPERGLFVEWAEMSSRERKPTHLPSLVSVDFVRHEPISGCGARVSNRTPLTVTITRSKAGTSAGEGSAYLFFDVKSICHRLFIPTTSPRRGRGRPHAG